MPDEDRLFGTDLKLVLKTHPDDEEIAYMDLSTARTGDLDVISGRDLMIQAIQQRLATRKGELAHLGHPEYGSLLEEMVGEPNTEDTRAIIETLVRDCLKYEPRISMIESVVATTDPRYPDVVNIDVVVRLRGSREPLSVEYPFKLGGG